MKKTPVNVSFDTEKLDALRMYLSRKGMDLEQEIDDFLEKSYQKNVPAAIKDFISARQTVDEKPGRKPSFSVSHSAQTEN